VCEWPSLKFALGTPQEDLRADGERILGQAAARARGEAPHAQIRTSIAAGDAASVLLNEAHDASLVVLGHGHNGVAELILGSVARKLAMHATCPVLVVRGTATLGGEVLLGVDGSPANEPAVGFAFDAASRRRVPLLAVHAWTHPDSVAPGDILLPVYDVAITEEDETRVLSEALAGWQEKYPDVTVRRLLDRAPTRRALIELSEHAQLLVLGRRGHGFGHLPLGSVTAAMLHHAHCPVVVVPSA
jgi:nucleotide-binding universal stress UspA family protein